MLREPGAPEARTEPRPIGPAGTKVAALPFQGTDEALVAGLIARHPGATAKFFDLHGARIHGLLYRILGPDEELEDLLHETFARALESIHTVRDPSAVSQWITGVAVFTARIRLQSKRRRWWLRFLPWDDLPEVEAPAPNIEGREALRSLDAALARLPREERLALVLRRLEGMKLEEAAQAAGTSLATFKRRLARAERTLLELARGSEALRQWLEEGGAK